jgi:hypothetical protein
MSEALGTDDGHPNGYAARSIDKGLQPGAVARAGAGTDLASGETRPCLILGYDGTDSALRAAALSSTSTLKSRYPTRILSRL